MVRKKIAKRRSTIPSEDRARIIPLPAMVRELEWKLQLPDTTYEPWSAWRLAQIDKVRLLYARLKWLDKLFVHYGEWCGHIDDEMKLVQARIKSIQKKRQRPKPTAAKSRRTAARRS